MGPDLIPLLWSLTTGRDSCQKRSRIPSCLFSGATRTKYISSTDNTIWEVPGRWLSVVILRYQLVGSKRFDDPTAGFGFTLIRKHPLTPEEERRIKSTWYEYLTIDGEIPSFPITELDLGLYRRKFTTGTILKLYSYDLPSGARSVISRDLNQSINEFLFAPALPLFTIDTPERYPDDRNLQRELYGLKRRLEEDDSKYVETHFSEEGKDREFGNFKLTCYIFRTRVENRSAQETRDTLRREFFKNNMSVLFSVERSSTWPLYFRIHYPDAETAFAQEPSPHSCRLYRYEHRVSQGTVYGI